MSTIPEKEPSAERWVPGMFRAALGNLILLTLLCGVLYPLATYGLANLFFPRQAHGSLVLQGDRAIGSDLIGQDFARPGYFWGRPSATAPTPDNAASSTGSNLGPLNPALRQAILRRIAALRAADPANTAPIPVDLVTTSASGIDPDISVAAARYQVRRIARSRNLAPHVVEQLIDRAAAPLSATMFGAPHVNLLALNRGLDRLPRSRPAGGVQPR